MQKKYFFRDLVKDYNLGEHKAFYAAGIVESLHAEIGKSNFGKDAAVLYLDPFSGTVKKEWRDFKDIYLIECDIDDEIEYESAKQSLELIRDTFQS